MKRPIRVLALIAMFALSIPSVRQSSSAEIPRVATHERWIRVDTPYFQLYTHRGKGTGKKVARDLLRLITILEYMSQGLEERPISWGSRPEWATATVWSGF